MSDFSSSPKPDNQANAERASAPSSRRRPLVIAAVLAALGLAAGGGWYAWHAGTPNEASAGAGAPGGPGGPRTNPVVVEAATSEDFPVRLSAIGTVVPRTVVTVRSRVDGTLNRVNFEEGQSVRRGDLLAEIDPRPFEVALTQVQGQMSKDEALLANARADLSRYEGLAKLDAIPAQQLDTQRALVRQYEAAVRVDQGAVDNARLQLSYTRITAPADGRAGLRQVDPGNLVRSSDANGIVVITQVQPVTVVFPIPEADLGKLLTRLGMQTPHEGGRSRGASREKIGEPGGDGAARHARGDAESAGAVRADRRTDAAAAGERGSERRAGADGTSREGRGNVRPEGGWQGRRDVQATAQTDGGERTGRSAERRAEGTSAGEHGQSRREARAGDTGASNREGRIGARADGGRKAGSLVVEAWDRDGKVLLATGELLTVDNQLDVTTGTVKVKAIFPNKDGALFPNQFVNVRLVVNELKDAVIIPSAAVQRGTKGTFVWLLNEDKTVAMRPVEVGAADGDRTPVLRGLQAGEQVAVDGFDRLRDGAKVEVVTQESRAVKEGPGKRGARRAGPGRGEGAAAAGQAPVVPGAPATPPAAAAPATVQTTPMDRRPQP